MKVKLLPRSVISLGLSTFRLLPGDEDGKAWSYAVATYNITLLCQVQLQPLYFFFILTHSLHSRRTT